jgi:hypothetical protein
MESCLERASYAILFHQKDYSLDYIISTFFPAETAEAHNVREALENDDRFSINNTEEGLLVGRINISSTDMRIQRKVEEWKDRMSSYFREYNCDVKLSMLSQIVKRPEDIPKHVNLIDVLNSDLQRRFLLILSYPNKKSDDDDVVIKYKHTPMEVEYYHEQWRQNVIKYLLQQSMPIPLVTIGTHVTKPKNLGKNQKLIDVVKLDNHSQKRFQIQTDPSHNSLTRLSLTQEYCCERWRQEIYQLWRASRPPRLLMDLDMSRAPRPAALSRHPTITLRDVLLQDPQQRFRPAPDYSKLTHFQHHHQQQHQHQHHERQSRPMPVASPLPRTTSTSTHQHHPRNAHTPLHTQSSGGHGQSTPQMQGYSQPQRRDSRQQPPHYQTQTQTQGRDRQSAAAGQGHKGRPASLRVSPRSSPPHSYTHAPSLLAAPPGFTPQHAAAPAPLSDHAAAAPTLTIAPAHASCHHHHRSLPSPPTSRLVSKPHSLQTSHNSYYNGFYDICGAPLPLEKTVSAEFSEYHTPPNLLGFLNNNTNGAGGMSKNSGDSHSHCPSAVPLLPLPAAAAAAAAALVLERSVSAEFQEYSAIPGLLRFLSDASAL